MKILRIALTLASYAFLGWISIGCAHGQVPPTTHSVALTWTAPTSGGTPPYTYIMSRITLTTGTDACPAVVYSPANYTPLNSANPVTPLSYTDTTASGTVCYAVQAEDTLKSVGNASNTAGPFAMPSNPGAPVTLGGAVTADMKQPPLPLPTESPDAMPVVAKLEGHIR